MSNMLIVYGTAEGQTAKISQHIACVLNEEGHTVQMLEGHELPKDFALKDFDGVLVGASVHSGKHDKRIVDFVKTNLDTLEDIPSAFFSVSLTASGTSEEDKAIVEDLLEQFSERTGWHPEKMGVFAGALLYTKHNPVIRFILKRITKKHGGDSDTSRDYEYTDWEGVIEFAKTFLPTLPARVS